MARRTTVSGDVSFARRFRHAVAQHGANPIVVLSDLAKLSRQANRLHAYEYFLYRPWEGERCDHQAKQTFLGADGNDRINASWIGGWPELTRDKLTVYALLAGFDLPIPQTQAVYDRERSLPGSEQLVDKQELLTFLRRRAHYPLFCKPASRPADCDSNVDAESIDSYDVDSDQLRKSNGSTIPVEEFVDAIVAAHHQTNSSGEARLLDSHLIQTRLRPHPELVAVCGPHISTVRLICVSDEQGVELLRASWKIPVGPHIADSPWRSGNLLAGVDPATGDVTHVVRPGALEYEPVERHPDTDAPLANLSLPDWSLVRQIVLRAAAAVPDCRVQGWDLALCESGPVIMELEAGGGDPMLTQLGCSTGLWAGRYVDFAQRLLAQRRSKFRDRWDEIKGNVAEQMTNFQASAGGHDEQVNTKREQSEKPTASDARDSRSDEGFELDAEANTDFSFAERLRHAVTEHNANAVTIVSDIARLSRRPNELAPLQYFLYQLWNEERFDAAAKQTFLGTGGWDRINKAIRHRLPKIAEDKLAISALLRAHGLSVPETQAIFHQSRHFPGAEQLTTREEVLSFLRERARYPLFGKPVGSQLSMGIAAIDGYDSESQQLELADGRRVPVQRFVDQITATDDDAPGRSILRLGAGYLFQSRLRPHPELAKIVGERTGTVRMVCVSDDEGVELVRASWKMPGGDNFADNLWRSGNMLAGIDVATGALTHVVRPGPREYENVHAHADSGVALDDMCFPEWQAMLDAVQQAAAAVRGCVLQGWDIALCEEGPVIVELQAGGGNPILAQLGYDRGLLTGRYAHCVRQALAT